MHPVKTVRIFLSSPGDVAAERVEVRKLLLGLERTPLLVPPRAHRCRELGRSACAGATMDAGLTPQQAVDRSLPTPAECDLTVVLLWGRMGTPLTEKKPDGTPYLSGTEWEFENALDCEQAGARVSAHREGAARSRRPGFDEKVAQKRRVDAFFERFMGEAARFCVAHATYDIRQDLLDRLRHGRRAVPERTGSESDAEGAAHSAAGVCAKRRPRAGNRRKCRSPIASG